MLRCTQAVVRMKWGGLRRGERPHAMPVNSSGNTVEGRLERFWMTTEGLFMAGAMGMAGVGALTDVVSHRIPNRLTYLGMLVAIVGRWGLEGWHGLGSALLGGLIGGGAFLAFFLVHAMGAGDVKLITAVGCFAGVSHTLEIVLATALAGGILALALAIWQRRLWRLLVNVVELIRFHMLAGAEVHPTLNLSNPEATRLPYGVAIAAGALYSVLAFYRRGGL
jgi:prepilin peptidase CpaA